MNNDVNAMSQGMQGAQTNQPDAPQEAAAGKPTDLFNQLFPDTNIKPPPSAPIQPVIQPQPKQGPCMINGIICDPNRPLPDFTG